MTEIEVQQEQAQARDLTARGQKAQRSGLVLFALSTVAALFSLVMVAVLLAALACGAFVIAGTRFKRSTNIWLRLTEHFRSLTGTGGTSLPARTPE